MNFCQVRKADQSPNRPGLPHENTYCQEIFPISQIVYADSLSPGGNVFLFGRWPGGASMCAGGGADLLDKFLIDLILIQTKLADNLLPVPL